jgi:glycosyltransferase involved in cell wall biosynthesis
VPLKNSDFFKGHRPCKTFEIMAMEIVPVILLNGEMRQLLDGKGVAHFVDPGSVEGLQACLNDCYNNRQLLQQMGVRGRQYIEQNFSMDIIGHNYFELIKEVVDNHQR